MKQASVLSFFKKTFAETPGSPTPKLLSFKESSSATPSNVTPSKKRKAEVDAETYNKQRCSDYDAAKRRRAFQPSWKNAHPWLTYDPVANLMWCSVCYEFRDKVNAKDMPMVEGTDLFRVQVVTRHANCRIHDKAMSIKAAIVRPNETPLAKIQKKLSVQNQERFRVLFNSAHCIAKKDWSLHSFTDLIQLQEKNGLHVGEEYWTNDHGPRMFLKHIAEVQRLKTKDILEQCRFFSVMADGSTDRSIVEQEAVYVRIVFNGIPVNKFLGLQELDAADAAGVLQAVDQALLTRAGISVDMQKRKLINVNLDGASVNMGAYNGVATQLQQRTGQQVIVTHCINHNLELAILDTRKEEPYLMEFNSTVKVI